MGMSNWMHSRFWKELDYEEFYSRLSAFFREKPIRIRRLNQLNTLLTGVVYVVYPLFLLSLIAKGDSRWIQTALIPAAAFVLVSALRKWQNRPRPYETWKIDPLIVKDTRGKSMPSRHVFSATVIAMAFLSVHAVLGIFFLVWSAVLALVRVLGGVHYPSDTIVGFLLGVAAGLLLFLY